jgi:hypothetical protein
VTQPGESDALRAFVLERMSRPLGLDAIAMRAVRELVADVDYRPTVERLLDVNRDPNAEDGVGEVAAAQLAAAVLIKSFGEDEE